MKKDEHQPQIISDHEIDSFRNKMRIWETIDIYDDQVRELFEILYPALLFSSDKSVKEQEFLDDYQVHFDPIWIYFPWNGVLVRSIRKEDFIRLKWNRNQLLITEEEMLNVIQTKIGVMGLSIGGEMAKGMIGALHASHVRIGDFDRLSTTNLNRLTAPMYKVGQRKTDRIATESYELNPFVEIKTFPEGVHTGNLDEFLGGKEPLDIVFDEIDDFEMKVRVRLAAKEKRIAVVMLTNLGNSILIDIERFDIEPEREIFHGLIPELADEILTSELTEEKKKKYAVEIVGRENVPDRAMNTLPEIGKTLVGRPQLLSSVMVSSGLASLVVRKIRVENLASGRYILSLDNIFKNDEK